MRGFLYSVATLSLLIAVFKLIDSFFDNALHGGAGLGLVAAGVWMTAGIVAFSAAGIMTRLGGIRAKPEP